MIFDLDVKEKGLILEIKGDCLERVAVVSRRKVGAVVNFELVDRSRRDGSTACLSIDVLASDAMLVGCVAVEWWKWLENEAQSAVAH